MKTKGITSILVILILSLNLTVCSKSSDHKSSDGSSNDTKGSSGQSGISDDNNDESGIKITVTGFPMKNGWFRLNIIEERPSSAYNEYIAFGQGDITNGKIDVFLETNLGIGEPWNESGEYYISLTILDDDYHSFFTDGKTLEELGIKLDKNGSIETGEMDWRDREYRKLPKYNLMATGNTIDFGKQVTRVKKTIHTFTGEEKGEA